MARGHIVCMVVLACVVGTHAFDAMGDYMPVSDVTKHAMISQDVCDIGEAVKDSSWDVCNTIYTEGKNSDKTPPEKRTLQGMANKDSSSALWQIFKGYKGGSNDWINDLEVAAIAGTAGYEAKEDFRQQVVKKIPQHLIVPLYVMHELDSAIGKIAEDKIEPATGAPHAWDEGWAFYYGENDGNRGCSPYGLSTSRGKDYNMEMKNVEAQVAQFNLGRDACVAGDAPGATTARDEISRLMKIPLIQAVLKYSLKLDVAVKAESSDISKYQGEAFAFYQFLEAQIGAADHEEYGLVGGDNEGAKMLAGRFAVTATPTEGNYAEAYCVLDMAMAKWGITWVEVGTFKDYTEGTVNCTTREVVGFEPTDNSAPGLGVVHSLFALLGSAAVYIFML